MIHTESHRMTEVATLEDIHRVIRDVAFHIKSHSILQSCYYCYIKFSIIKRDLLKNFYLQNGNKMNDNKIL